MVNTVKNLEPANYQHQLDNLTNINVKYAPLSFAQERIWFLEQLEPNSTAYNMLQPFQLEGNVDVKALEYSINEIIARHDSLRTRFVLEKEKPVQIVLPELSVTLPLVDLSHLSAQEQQINIKEIISKTVEEKFDLEKAPLLRVTLLRLSAQVHQLLVTTHHIISDGWSYDVFIKDLEQFYTAFVTNKTPELPKLPLQYPDYAESQKNNFTEDILKSKLAYWEKHLQGNLPILQLPLDHPRQPERTVPSGREEFYLDGSLTEKLKALSRQEGVTLYMTLLAAVNTLLYRYSHQEDIIIGTPIAGRNEKGTRDLIGCFINTLALRTDLSGNPTFQELLKRVRQVALGAYRHLDTPFEKLVETLKPERELTINPIFQVLFAFQNTPRPQLSLPELTITPLDIQRGTAMFDLMIEIKETSQGLTVWFNYDCDLLASATMQPMINHFHSLIKGIIENPRQRILDLPLLTVAEQHQILVKWNETQKNYPLSQCVPQRFEAQVGKTPKAIAVSLDGQTLTYQELNHRANQVAHYLRSLGVKADTLVGLHIERSLNMMIGLLGILKAGGAYVPLDPAYPQERLELMAKDSQIAIILTQSTLVNQLPNITGENLCLDQDWSKISQYPTSNPSIEINPENLAYVIYTSGSTGKPKGIEMTHLALTNLIFWQQDTTTVTPSAKTLQFSPISFDVSFQEIFSTWCSGGCLVLIADDLRRDSRLLLRFLINNNIERLFLPFVALQQLAEVAEDKNIFPINLREIITAGEQLQITPAIARLCQNLPNCCLHNHYGPSETHVVTSLTLTGAVEQWSSLPPIGRPIANTQIYILDQSLQPVPIGVSGELYIGGVCLARGYLNRPDLSDQKFVDHPFEHQSQALLYRTGDLARYLADGTIEFLGRIDNQVKIRGFRIELGEIEALIAQYSQVKEVVVMAQQRTSRDQCLVAYIVAHQKTPNLVTELRRFLQNHLPEYMIPSAFVVLERFPITPSGKVDRRSLPIPDLIHDESQEKLIAPRNDIEQQLVAIWEQLLGIEPIGVTDNFFNLGGHSLIAVRLFSLIEKVFKINLPLSTLFKAPTVEELALIIQSSEQVNPWDSVVLLKPGNPTKSPLFLIHEADGKVFLYLNLAKRLQDDRPVYGLRPYSQKNFPCLHTSIKEMTSYYVDQILTIQPQGPYLLGGLCAGGILAYEAAVQLQAKGKETALVAIIDAPDIQAPCQHPTAKNRSKNFIQAITNTTSLPSKLKIIFNKSKNLTNYLVKTRWRKVLNNLKIIVYQNYLHQNRQIPQWLHDIPVRRILEYSAQSYLPESYQGKVTLFKATEKITVDDPSIDDTPFRDITPEPLFGWDKRATEVEVDDIAGGHSSCLQEPFVEDLAKKLQQCINLLEV